MDGEGEGGSGKKDYRDRKLLTNTPLNPYKSFVELFNVSITKEEGK
ncbi:MAG: hypothetical protein WCF60_10820 [Anaerobacillus sp.]